MTQPKTERDNLRQYLTATVLSVLNDQEVVDAIGNAIDRTADITLETMGKQKADGQPKAKGKPRIYLSAAMRGVPEYNFPLVGKWAKRFREAGVSVYSGVDTAELIGQDAPICEHMAKDCQAICRPVKAVVVLDWGEPESLGVRAECALAESIGVPVVGLSDADYSEQEIEQRFEQLVKGLKS